MRRLLPMATVEYLRRRAASLAPCFRPAVVFRFLGVALHAALQHQDTAGPEVVAEELEDVSWSMICQSVSFPSIL